MPHESTVDDDTPTEPFMEESPMAPRARPFEDIPTGKKRPKISPQDTVPHLRAETPRKITHHHDEDDSEDEDSSSSNCSVSSAKNGVC